VNSGSRDAANPARGEAELICKGEALILRPSFAALVAAEQELGPLFALVERASSGGLCLEEMIALFWHCLSLPPSAITRADIGDAVVAMGLAKSTPILRILLQQILAGQS
jgi:hypothetical protein